MSDEISEVKNFIYDTLAADATLQGLLGGATNPRIYADQLPQGVLDAGSVAVLFNVQSPGGDVAGLGSVRLMTAPLVRVTTTRKGQPNAAQRQVYERIDTLLQAQRANTSGAFRISLRREFPLDRAYYDTANNRYHDLGGLYRAWVTRT